MKFISSKKIQDHAHRHYEIQKEMSELRAKLRALKEEKESLEQFIGARTHEESFQFADPEGYLMEMDFEPRARQDLNDEAIRRFYAQQGRKVPMKTSEWIEVKTRYITE
jgi:hypothetical protein